MNKEEEINLLENTCSALLTGFIEWIQLNSKEEIAVMLDGAVEFKNSILNQDRSTIQKKYFINNGLLTKEETCLLTHRWKETFSQLVNSELDRASKDSFKIWFLSIASQYIANCNKDGVLLWSKLIEGIDFCKKFSIEDIPYPYNTITKN